MWEASANFKDVININIQLNFFDYMVKVILNVVIEKFVDYIRNVYFKLGYFTFKLWINLFHINYLKNLDY